MPGFAEESMAFSRAMTDLVDRMDRGEIPEVHFELRWWARPLVKVRRKLYWWRVRLWRRIFYRTIYEYRVKDGSDAQASR